MFIRNKFKKLFASTLSFHIIGRYFFHSLSMHNYEIEIKVLLGNATAKDEFVSKVQNSFPGLTHAYSESQRNHYFDGGSLDGLQKAF